MSTHSFDWPPEATRCLRQALSSGPHAEPPADLQAAVLAAVQSAEVSGLQPHFVRPSPRFEWALASLVLCAVVAMSALAWLMLQAGSAPQPLWPVQALAAAPQGPGMLVWLVVGVLAGSWSLVPRTMRGAA
jgi:hypothetical protein